MGGIEPEPCEAGRASEGERPMSKPETTPTPGPWEVVWLQGDKLGIMAQVPVYRNAAASLPNYHVGRGRCRE